MRLIFFLFSFFYIFDLHAETVPSYCAFYPKYIDGEKIDQNLSLEQRSSGEVSVCSKTIQHDYSLLELEQMVKNVEEESLDQMGKTFQKELAAEAVKQVLEKKSLYYKMSNPTYIYPENLKACGQDHLTGHQSDSFLGLMRLSKREYNSGIGKEILKDIVRNNDPNDRELISKHTGIKKLDKKVDKTLQDDAVRLNIINTMKAAALFKNNINHEKYIDNVNLTSNQERNQCVRDRQQCKKDTLIWERTEHCSTTHEACVENAKIKKDKKLKILRKNIEPLYAMVTNSPLLFNNANEDSLLDPVFGKDLAPSKLMNIISKNIPNHLIQTLSKHLKKADEKAIDLFFDKNINLINHLAFNEKTRNEINKATDDEVSKELERLDRAANAICEGEGENLHHRPGLVNKVLARKFNNVSDKNFLKREVAANQAAYCHLLNNKPVEGDEISAATIGGFAMLGVGVGLQFIPGVGTIAGGYLLTLGTGLATVGGGALTAVGIKDYFDSNALTKQDIGLQSAGLHGYQEILDKKKVNRENFAWAAADIGLFMFDLKALHKARKNQKDYIDHGRLADELRDSIQKIEDDLKIAHLDDVAKNGSKYEKKTVEMYNEIYNPNNVHNLGPKDQIYIAGIVDGIESDLSVFVKRGTLELEFPEHANELKKLKSDKEKVRFLVNKELDDIIKECSGRAKK